VRQQHPPEPAARGLLRGRCPGGEQLAQPTAKLAATEQQRGGGDGEGQRPQRAQPAERAQPVSAVGQGPDVEGQADREVLADQQAE
jgi:hypothetical protein